MRERNYPPHFCPFDQVRESESEREREGEWVKERERKRERERERETETRWCELLNKRTIGEKSKMFIFEAIFVTIQLEDKLYTVLRGSVTQNEDPCWWLTKYVRGIFFFKMGLKKVTTIRKRMNRWIGEEQRTTCKRRLYTRCALLLIDKSASFESLSSRNGDIRIVSAREKQRY